MCANVEEVRRLVKVQPELAFYHTNPPGVGQAVIYVTICKENHKLYVGKHVHGKRGTSVMYSRWHRHEKGEGGAELLYRSICKYGTQAFEWFVIDRVPECEVSAREKYWIAKLETMNPHGFNLHEGGEGGVLTPEHKANIAAALARRDVKDRIAETNATQESKKRRRDAAKEVANRPSVKKKRAAWFDNAEWMQARSKVLSVAICKARKSKPVWISADGLQSMRTATRLRREDEALEDARKKRFCATWHNKRKELYKEIAQTNVLPWPKNPLDRMPRPQYYRRGEKIGFCSGSAKRFMSIKPNDGRRVSTKSVCG